VTPDIGTRLATISMALRQVVIPALPPNEVLAIEQATLCVGHLGVLSEQYNYLADYETLCLTEMAGLGQQLADAVSSPGESVASEISGDETRAAADRLRQVVAEAGTLAAPAHTRRERRNQIASAIDELLMASLTDGSPGFVAASERLVVAHGEQQTLRDRAWFQHTGMDPDRAALPSIPDLIS
jgi:hypothetical protein